MPSKPSINLPTPRTLEVLAESGLAPFETHFRVKVVAGRWDGIIGTAIARWGDGVLVVVPDGATDFTLLESWALPHADDVEPLTRDGCYELWLDARPSLDHPLDDGGVA